ncbi:MAG TPA: isochorismatase family cysteine hydrolase, partial [Vicinamibacterales bacterium]|nr:isochorismatase family cysteine hydrolase [Vicinamibacterales bacterium]
MAQSVFPKARTALLLVDVINLFDFPRGAGLARRALAPARNIRRLRDRAHANRIPVIYVNDNWGRWRSDFKAIVADCSRPDRPGAPIAELLAPTARDFFVLKPHLSGFHDTPLDTLLQSGEVQTVVVVGFAADNCVFFTAAEAHMRDYKVVVPSDCCASEADEERRHALAKMRKFLDAETSSSRRIRLRR